MEERGDLRGLERAWWLRAVLVLRHPGSIFTALRDDSERAASARQEPVVALVFLAGIAAVLPTRAAGRLLDDPEVDLLAVPVWVLLAGLLWAAGTYWVGGGLLALAARWLGSEGSGRRIRHVLAFAAAPLALSLILWPVRLALYGGDLFRPGGDDAGPGNTAFEVLVGACALWSAALLVFGVRMVHGWSWLRSGAACGLAAAVLAALVVLLSVL